MATASLLQPETLATQSRAPAMPCRLAAAAPDQAPLVVVRMLRWLRGKRLTAEGRLDGRRVAVKIFFGADAQRHEGRVDAGVARIIRAGLTTPALLERRRYGDSFVLLYEWLEGAALADPGALRRSDAWAFAPLMAAHARLHAVRAWHRDPHLENFLARPGSEGDLALLDPDAVRAAPLRPGWRRRALVRQLAEFRAPSEGALRALLLGYDATPNRGEAMASQPGLLGAVHRRRVAIARELVRKTHRGSTHFEHIRTEKGYALRDRRLGDGFWRRFLEDPDGLVSQGRWLKNGGSASVVALDVPEGSFVLKRYNLKQARRLPGRVSRAERSWAGGLLLRSLGIPAAEPLALHQERRFGAQGRAWLLMQALEGVLLDKLIDSTPLPCWPEGLRLELQRLFRLLARYGVRHGDFKATNFMVVDGGLRLIDLDALRLGRPGPRGLARDLARFRRNFRRSDDLSAFDALLGSCFSRSDAED